MGLTEQEARSFVDGVMADLHPAPDRAAAKRDARDRQRAQAEAGHVEAAAFLRAISAMDMPANWSAFFSSCFCCC